MTIGSERISKSEWYRRGANSNPRCWRRQRNGSSWQYFYRLD